MIALLVEKLWKMLDGINKTIRDKLCFSSWLQCAVFMNADRRIPICNTEL